jgi:hypothetical protein
MNDVAVKIGDVFLVPYENKFAVCKVLWLSRTIKKVFSFIVKDELATSKEESLKIADSNRNISVKIYSGVINVFYTDITKLIKGEWIVSGNLPLTKEESDDFQYHNIGGMLFKGDEEIRPLSPEEMKTTPKILSAGYEAITGFLKMAFS